MDKDFEPGEVVEHRLSREWVMVLSHNLKDKTYTCRTKSFDEKVFFAFELNARK